MWEARTSLSPTRGEEQPVRRRDEVAGRLRKRPADELNPGFVGRRGGAEERGKIVLD